MLNLFLQKTKLLGYILDKMKFFFLAFIFLIIIAFPNYTSAHLKHIKYKTATDVTIVQKYRQLRVEGNKIVNQSGDPVSLHGMSLFWSQWEGARFYNSSCMEWLRDDWKCTVVRAAMGVESGGYLQNPQTEKNKVINVIQACIDLGIYVIVDWHDHHAQDHQQEAIDFFSDIAKQYGTYPNLIYEIFNEPQQVSWTNVVKPYAEAVIDTIRAIDPDNLIIVGTPTWSQDVDTASRNPLDYNNIAYALHFYAATHKQSLRNKATVALNNGIALFVSEFGTCESSGSGFLDSAETETWMNFMESNMLSWCNWAIDDKNETSAALKSGTSSNGGWPTSMLTASGYLIREKLRDINIPLPVELVSFTANVIDDYVQLNWSTASEINNKGFEILRKEISENGEESDWEQIGFVDGNGTSTKIQNYSFIDKDIFKGKYVYKLKQIDFDGSLKFSKELEVKVNISGFRLDQNYPNPFNPKTTIEYELENDGPVKLEVFNINGSKIRTLTDGYMTGGVHKVTWDGNNDKGVKAASGVYFYSLFFENELLVKKAIQLN